jgi:hypothetical protein
VGNITRDSVSVCRNPGKSARYWGLSAGQHDRVITSRSVRLGPAAIETCFNLLPSHKTISWSCHQLEGRKGLQIANNYILLSNLHSASTITSSSHLHLCIKCNEYVASRCGWFAPNISWRRGWEAHGLAKENIILPVTKTQLSSPLKLNHLQVTLRIWMRGAITPLPIRPHDAAFNHMEKYKSKRIEYFNQIRTTYGWITFMLVTMTLL